MIRVTAHAETWPIAGSFTIARSRTTTAEVIVAEVSDGRHTGRGEATPVDRYDQTTQSACAVIESVAPAFADGAGRAALQTLLPPGAARNALDCALWDLESRRAERPVWDLAGRPAPVPVVTAYTISLGTPEAMAAQTARNADRPLLKVKLGGDGDDDRMAAVREAAPQARLIADANESWTLDHLRTLPARLAALGVELIEQPLPQGADDALGTVDCPLPVCADESFHDLASLAAVRGRYQAVNIKLDKTGGLTEALRIAESAQAADIKIFAGCMVATSLAMVPSLIFADAADWIDLDGPLLLARDRVPGLDYGDNRIAPPPPGLWGYVPRP